MNNKTLLLSFLFLFTFNCYAQQAKIERIDGKIFIVDKDSKRLINESTITVKLKPAIEQLSKDLIPLRSNKLGYVDLSVPKGMLVETYFEEMKARNQFDLVKFVEYGETAMSHNDSNYYIQQPYLNCINMEEAWDITTGNQDITVAVIDTEVDWNHIDIGYGTDSYKNIDATLGYNYLENTVSPFQPHYHGTGVAGIIGAKTNNGKGVAGVSGGNNSSGVTIIPFCVGGENGSDNIDMSMVDDAIINAVDKGVKIINLSITSGSNYHPDIDAAINYANNHGVTMIAATGNHYFSHLEYPASNSYTIAIGATDCYNNHCYDSNYGNGIDLAAPGESVYTTNTNNDYQYISGTSFATSLVTGTVALMRSVNSSLTPNQIRDIFKRTAKKIPGYTYDSSGWNSEVGYGVLNAFAAVLAACNTSFLDDTSICYGSSSSFSLNNLPSGLTVQWSITDGFGPYSPTLQTSGNSCTITNNLSMTFKGKLNAKVYNGGDLIATLSKKLILYSDFYGQYTSGNLSGTIDYTHIFYVKPGFSTVISSPSLKGATASYSSSGTTPLYFSLDPTQGQLQFTMPTSNNGIPVVINVEDVCGNQFQLYAMPQNSYYLIISYEGSNINISLNEDGDALRNSSIDQPWSYEIRSATRGELKMSGTVNSRSTTISTAGWPKGIYIIKATIGKEETTEKIIVR